MLIFLMPVNGGNREQLKFRTDRWDKLSSTDGLTDNAPKQNEEQETFSREKSFFFFFWFSLYNISIFLSGRLQSHQSSRKTKNYSGRLLFFLQATEWGQFHFHHLCLSALVSLTEFIFHQGYIIKFLTNLGRMTLSRKTREVTKLINCLTVFVFQRLDARPFKSIPHASFRKTLRKTTFGFFIFVQPIPTNLVQLFWSDVCLTTATERESQVRVPELSIKW